MSMTNVCPNCGAVNNPGARFCNQCSTALSQLCPNCGQSQALSAKFCNACGQTLMAAQKPLPPTGRLAANTLLAGRYQIVRKLGQGGMGAVYLAADQRLIGKHVALKEMSDQAIADPAERLAAAQAFEQEAQMLANLDHANLPKVTDYFNEGGNQYLVMELVQGQTLEKKLEMTAGPLMEPTVRNYAGQLCGVLGYLHSQQPPIIFRDLKPANIMVLPGDGQIKLIDFGIARHFKPGKGKDTQAMGTPGYAAPEQYGHGQSDARTDIYALGATLHHMLTGRNPGGAPFQFANVRDLNPVVSGSLDAIVARSLALDPNQRWRSVAEIQDALAGRISVASSPTLVSAMPQPAPALAARTATQAPMPSGQPFYPALAGAPVNMPPGLTGSTFADYSKRVGGLLLDAFLVSMLVGFGLFVGGGLAASSNDPGGLAAIFLLSICAGWLYFIWPTATSGQTPGKRAVGIKVVNADGQPPGWGRALRRYLIGYMLELILLYLFVGALGLLWPLWDVHKQAWHDKIGDTYVVEK